tara:strand:- start:5878 stop:6363 length:486 start_codon:yes stop_codon:yes gene_type:complete
MRNESEIITRRYELNREAGRAVVVVNLRPCKGREPIVRVKINDVRSWLENEENIKLGEAIQGRSINNNMSRRLGINRSPEDLEMTYVFEIIKEKKEVKSEKPTAKATPKKTTTRKVKTTTKSTATKTESPSKKPTSTRRTRTRKSPSTTSKKITTNTQGDK